MLHVLLQQERNQNLDRDPRSLYVGLAIQRQYASYDELRVHRERILLYTISRHCIYMRIHLAFSIVISEGHIERLRTLFWFDLLCPYITHCCFPVFSMLYDLIALLISSHLCFCYMCGVDLHSTTDRSRHSVWMSCTSAIVVAADTHQEEGS